MCVHVLVCRGRGHFDLLNSKVRRAQVRSLKGVNVELPDWVKWVPCILSYTEVVRRKTFSSITCYNKRCGCLPQGRIHAVFCGAARASRLKRALASVAQWTSPPYLFINELLRNPPSLSDRADFSTGYFRCQ